MSDKQVTIIYVSVIYCNKIKPVGITQEKANRLKFNRLAFDFMGVPIIICTIPSEILIFLPGFCWSYLGFL